MKLISHRGNINGRNPKRENRLDHLLEALNKGYQIEIDVWYEDKQWWLGHDEPQYKSGKLIFENAWIHAKNKEALEELSKTTYNFFWHDKDKYTLTSKGVVWCLAGEKVLPKSICVLPENGYTGDIRKCSGICSDYIERYAKQISKLSIMS